MSITRTSRDVTVSVALPTYNGEKYLETLLGSIIEQKVQPNEIVIVDDGSGDGTPEILKSYAKNYPDLVTIRLAEENIGMQENYERTIRLCSCDYIALADQDDRWHENKLARQLEILKHKPDIGLVYHNSRLTDKNLEPKGVTLWDCLGYKSTGGLRNGPSYVRRLASRNFVQGTTALFDRELIIDALPLPNIEPHDHWLSLAVLGKASAFEIDEVLLSYRQHEQQRYGLKNPGWQWIMDLMTTTRNDRQQLVEQLSAETEELWTQRERLIRLYENQELAQVLEKSLRERHRFFQNRSAVHRKTAKRERFKYVMENVFKGGYGQYGPRYRVLEDVLDALGIEHNLGPLIPLLRSLNRRE